MIATLFYSFFFFSPFLLTSSITPVAPVSLGSPLLLDLCYGAHLTNLSSLHLYSKAAVFSHLPYIHVHISRNKGPSLFFSRGHATLHLAVLVRRSVCNIFEWRAVFVLLLLPNRPRQDCRVSGLVSIASSTLRLYQKCLSV